MATQTHTIKSAFVLLLVSLLLWGSFGVSHMMGMTMDKDGNMTDCPFMLDASICTMTPVEMVIASQSFLSNVSLQQDFTALLALATTLALMSFVSFFSPPKIALRYRVPKRTLQIRHSFLDEAFSNGILNPKLF